MNLFHCWLNRERIFSYEEAALVQKVVCLPPKLGFTIQISNEPVCGNPVHKRQIIVVNYKNS